ncbi:hypothetical protein AB0918_09880 [Streptomyces sp. NPDC006864]|uniref:hypothetical protein n=1 Tax=Streptomyces sp. NPDC006864 TaxID=3154780 RepID=UPI00345535DA
MAALSAFDDRGLLQLFPAQRATLTATGDFAYFTDIAHFMGGLPLPEPSSIRWVRSEDDVRSAWHGLVQARQEHLLAGS